MLLELFVGSSVYGVLQLLQLQAAQRNLKKGKSLKNGETLQSITDCSNCIELYTNEQRYEPPIFINTGNSSAVGVGIPIGGGLSSDWKRIYSVVYGDDNEINYMNYTTRFDNTPPSTHYINTGDDLTVFMNSHPFIGKSSFPVKLPLKVQSYSFKKAAPALWIAPKVAVIADSIGVAKVEAALNYTFRGWRYPVAAIAGVTWLATAGLCWLTWHEYEGPKQQLQEYTRKLARWVVA